jgi:Calcineurin-like phosphoesterase
MRQLLQVVHVTDLHWLEPASAPLAVAARDGWDEIGDQERTQAPTRRERFEEWLFKSGTAGSSVLAREQFARSLAEVLPKFPDWEHRWLVATGDLSAWGDDPSINHAIGWLSGLARDHKMQWTAIYGNHDVWLGNDPPRESVGAAPFDVRRTLLRAHTFLGNWPLIPLVEGTKSVPSSRRLEVTLQGGHQLVGYSLNTIIHEPAENRLAFGRVREDRYWEPATPLAPQLDEVKRQWRAGDVGIVFTHHPVYYPGLGTSRRGNVLLNDREVAKGLGERACIFVSGHTHKVFPKPGKLPAVLPRRPRHRLAARQVQLITGTLCQGGFGGRDPDQSWQLLHVSEDEKTAGLALERIVFRRSRGTGPFVSIGPRGGYQTEKLAL